jgi:hypothetical protein
MHATQGVADLTLELVELNTLDPSPVGVDTISIRVPPQIGNTMVISNIDANRTTGEPSRTMNARNRQSAHAALWTSSSRASHRYLPRAVIVFDEANHHSRGVDHLKEARE